MARAWRAYLAFGLLCCLVYLPLGPSAASVLFLVVSGSSAVALLVGVRLHRPAQPLPWYLLAAGTRAVVLGDHV